MDRLKKWGLVVVSGTVLVTAWRIAPGPHAPQPPELHQGPETRRLPPLRGATSARPNSVPTVSTGPRHILTVPAAVRVIGAGRENWTAIRSSEIPAADFHLAHESAPVQAEVEDSWDWPAQQSDAGPRQGTSAAFTAVTAPSAGRSDPGRRLPVPSSIGPLATQQVLDAALAEAFSLAERGAIYTARGKLLQVLTTVAQDRDRRSGTAEAAERLGAAFTALEESAEFRRLPLSPQQSWTDLTQIAQFHRTQLLSADALRELPPLAAATRYEQYAQTQLVEALRGEASASKALFGLARVEQLLPLPVGTDRQQRAQRAAVLYAAALGVDPGNFLAANELGVLLSRGGRHSEALDVLQQAARHRGDRPEIWHNLARVHVALGQHVAAELALREMQTAQRRTGPPAGVVDSRRVTWVAPEQFATGSATPAAATPATAAAAEAWGLAPPARPPQRPAATRHRTWWR